MKPSIKAIISIAIISLLAGFSTLILLAQLNYASALNAVEKTDKTDSDIENTMMQYGFNVKWHDPVTISDKINALFNHK